jgi:hypothetical protein
MPSAPCEPPSEPDCTVDMKLDIICQVYDRGSRCDQPASGYVRYPETDVTLAACQGHISRLCPRSAKLLTGLSRSDSDRLYKEARQWDEWLEQQNDPHGTVCRDAAAVATPANDVSFRSGR